MGQMIRCDNCGEMRGFHFDARTRMKGLRKEFIKEQTGFFKKRYYKKLRVHCYTCGTTWNESQLEITKESYETSDGCRRV